MSRVYLSLILIIPFVLSSCGSYKPEIIAHRGASGIEVQNTIEAVQAAIDLKSDAIEIDIWKTADDSLVVFHDRNTGRLSEDTLEIPESTFQELRSIDLVHGRKIPNLRDVLEMLPDDMRLFIEIKCCWEPGEAGNVFPRLSDMIKATGTEDRAVIISFNPEKLVDAYRYLPKISRYLLLWEKESPREMVQAALECHADGINMQFALLNEDVMREARKSNLEVYVWTVNAPEDATKLINNYGKIDGITTNFPHKMLKEIEANDYR